MSENKVLVKKHMFWEFSSLNTVLIELGISDITCLVGMVLILSDSKKLNDQNIHSPFHFISYFCNSRCVIDVQQNFIWLQVCFWGEKFYFAADV